MEGSEVRRRSNLLLEEVIRPATEQTGYALLRADEISAGGLISAQIVTSIFESDLIIADLSGRNPNVLYELGISHAISKPTILVVAVGEVLPFDLAALRAIFVDLTDEASFSRARRSLISAITQAGASPEAVDNPITAAAAVRSFESAPRERISSAKGTEAFTVTSVLADIDGRMRVLEHQINRVLQPVATQREYSRRVFIVHGHDGELKNELARLLTMLDFDPIILHEQPDRGRTIFAKLDGELSDIGYAFILLTPDDVGSKSSQTSELRPRARQNVVFEHGLLVGRLAPTRVCAIRRGDVEIPSDLQGVIYKALPMGQSVRSIALELAQELQAAGYLIDANKMIGI